MFNIEGHVEIHVKDAVTGNIIEKREHKNRLSYAAMLAYVEKGGGFGPYVGISSDQTEPRPDDLMIKVYGETLTLIGTTPPSETSPSFSPATVSTPATATFVARFSVPAIGTSRTIWSIFLTGLSYNRLHDSNGIFYNTTMYEPSSSNHGIGFYPNIDYTSKISTPTYSSIESTVTARLKLDIPCIQTDTQVLDVYYRIKFTLPVPNTTGVTDSYLNYIIKRMSGQPSPWYDYVHSNWSNKWPASGQSFSGLQVQPFLPAINDWNEGFKDFIEYGTRWHHVSGVMPSVTRTTEWLVYKHRFGWTEDLTANVGRILGTIHYGGIWTNSTASWHKVLPADVNPNVMIQPIHNHSWNAVSPFIDVDKLAVGQGTIVATNNGWVNKDYPEFYRIQIVADGEPGGTAAYTVFKRNHFGFITNNYQERPEILPWFSAKPVNVFEKNHGVIEHHPKTTTNGYGAELAYGFNALRYDYTSVVTADKSGVQWTSVISPQSYAWDATSSSPLPATYIHQMAVNAPKIWVACRDTGLYVIDKDLNTVVKKSIPGTLDKCYGVAIGYNNSIWAVMDGGIVSSTNGGTTWTVYNSGTSPAFTFVGISDNNWSTVAYIRVDKSHVDSRMLLVRNETAPVLQTTAYVWWSATTPATAGYVGTGAKWLRQHKHLCDVNDQGWWIGGFNNSYNEINSQDLYELTFNSASIVNTGGVLGGEYKGPYGSVIFETLPTGEQCLFLLSFKYDYWGSNTSDVKKVQLLRRYDYAKMALVVHVPPWNNESFYTDYYRNVYLGKGVMIFTKPVQEAEDTAVYIRNQHIMIDVLWDSSLGGPYSKLVWDEYRWNGSSWALNYHAPLTDSSGNANHGERKLFWPNSRYFQGQDSKTGGDGYGSHVIIDNAFASGFNTQMTIAMTVTSSQSTGWAQLFEVASANSTQKFLVSWNTDVNNTIGIWSGVKTEFGLHPTDGSAHRLVITVNGTTVKCYLDGGQLGTTKTIASIPISNIVKATIGASRHAGWAQQFFTGTLTNIQVWNVEWLATDVVFDFANQSSLVSDQGGSPFTPANLKMHFQNTGALAETKICHTASEPLIEGINLAFTAGSIGVSFKSGDYYTFGAVDGVWKDNATTYTGSYSIYSAPMVKDCTDVQSSGVVTILPAISGLLIKDWDGQGLTPPPTVNGSTGRVTFDGKNTGVVSRTVLYGDFEVTFTGLPTTGLPAEMELEFGVGAVGNSYTKSYGKKDFYYHVNQSLTGRFGTKHDISDSNRQGHIWDQNKNPLSTGGYVTTAGTRTDTDVFKFKRVGDTITLYLNGTLVSTTTGVRRKGFSPKMRVIKQTTGSSIQGPLCTVVTSAASLPIAMLGNKINRTGMFDPEFAGIDVDPTMNSVRDVKLNGVPVATKYYAWEYDSLPALPVLNEVIITSNGFVICNPSDNGKTLTATYNYLKHPA